MSLAKDAVDFAKGAKPGDLIFPNTIGSVEGHFLRKLQTIAERAGVMEPELHRFRRYARVTSNEHCPSLFIIVGTGKALIGKSVCIGFPEGGRLRVNRNRTSLTSRRWRCMPRCLHPWAQQPHSSLFAVNPPGTQAHHSHHWNRGIGASRKSLIMGTSHAERDVSVM